MKKQNRSSRIPVCLAMVKFLFLVLAIFSFWGCGGGTVSTENKNNQTKDVVSGRFVDAENGKAVEGARVTFLDNGESTESDSEGIYTIVLDDLLERSNVLVEVKDFEARLLVPRPEKENDQFKIDFVVNFSKKSVSLSAKVPENSAQ